MDKELWKDYKQKFKMNDFSKPHYFLRNKIFKTQDTSIDVKFFAEHRHKILSEMGK